MLHRVIFLESKKKNKKVFNAQKKIIRIMTNVKKESLVENGLRNFIYFPFPANSDSHYCIPCGQHPKSSTNSDIHNTNARHKYDLHISYYYPFLHNKISLNVLIFSSHMMTCFGEPIFRSSSTFAYDCKGE
jgi:hypothetical protein